MDCMIEACSYSSTLAEFEKHYSGNLSIEKDECVSGPSYDLELQRKKTSLPLNVLFCTTNTPNIFYSHAAI